MLRRVLLLLIVPVFASLLDSTTTDAATCGIAMNVPTSSGYDEGCWMYCEGTDKWEFCEESLYYYETFNFQCSSPILTCEECVRVYGQDSRVEDCVGCVGPSCPTGWITEITYYSEDIEHCDVCP